MSAIEPLKLLLSEIDRSLQVLGRIEQYYDQYTQAMDRVHPTRENAIVVAEILVNYYTCLETAFLRISQQFENNLDRDRWHNDLLDRMLLEVEGTRPQVLSEVAHGALRELMRFRHFKRYYLEFDYDWDRLQFLQRKLAAARACVREDLALFQAKVRAAVEE